MNYHQFTMYAVGYITLILAAIGLFFWSEKHDLKKYHRKRTYLDVTSELAHRPIQDEVMDIKMGELL